MRGRTHIPRIKASLSLSAGSAKLARGLIAPVAVAALSGLSLSGALAQTAPDAAASSSLSSASNAPSSALGDPKAPKAVVQALPKPPVQEKPEAAPVADPDAPIIPDADFNAALPSLDAAPEPAPDAAAAPAPPEPAPTEPAVDTTQGETTMAPVASPDDPELTAALPPLEGYDVQAVQATPPPAVQPQVTYTTSVDGLAEIGQYDKFRSLSALHGGKGKAANSAMVRARATEDQGLALRLMKSVGYFDGTVSGSLSTPVPPTGTIDVHIVTVPGPLYKLGTIAIDASPTTPPDLIRSALPLRTGDPIVADQVIAAEANVSLVLPQRGYPFAHVLNRDIALDAKTAEGDYTLHVEPGNRADFGAFTTDGKLAFDARHIAVLKRFKQGDLYDSRKVDDLRQALISTGLFSTVSVEPVRTGKIDADGTETVDLAVHQQAGPARTLAATAGYSTGEGFTVAGTWTNRNLWPPEGALILTGTLGTQEQGLSSTFRRSNDGRRDLTFTATASAAHSVYDTYTAYTTGLTTSWARVSTPLWQKLWTWSYGAELLASREEATVIGTTLSQYETYYLLNVPLKLDYDKSNDLLNPTTGYRLGVSGGPQVSLSGAGATSVRVVLDGSYYYPIGAKLTLAARTRFGSLLGGNVATIAPSRRLYAGGGGSVRGYAYQGLGPLDANNNPTGGTSLFEASVEARYRMGDLGIVPFVDVGQVYDANLPDFSNLRVGVGVGARLYTNFGPIRVDVATPVTRRKGEPLVALYVGIGQAF